jgi:hypothetical protein
MAYPIPVTIDIGTTGLTLLATFRDTSGTIHASLRNLATTEIADGFYQFYTTLAPDGYLGSILFHTGTYTSGIGDIDILAAASVNPRELENADVKTSTLGGAGTGPFAITITVTDGTDPLQNVTAALYDGSTLAGRLVTDVNGNATFALAAGTYTVNLYKGGYTFASTTRTVTGNQAGTLVDDLEMTASGSITPPANPDLCTLFGFILLASGEPAIAAKVEATLVTNRPGEASGSIIATQAITTLTDSNGEFQMDLVRNDAIDATSTYKIKCLPAGIELANISLTTPTQDLADLIPA